MGQCCHILKAILMKAIERTQSALENSPRPCKETICLKLAGMDDHPLVGLQ